MALKKHSKFYNLARLHQIKNLNLSDINILQVKFGKNLTIRSKLRLIILLVFLCAAPSLMIGIINMQVISNNLKTYKDRDIYQKLAGKAVKATANLNLALWKVKYQPKIKNEQFLTTSLHKWQKINSQLMEFRIDYIDISQLNNLNNIVNKLNLLIKKSVILKQDEVALNHQAINLALVSIDRYKSKINSIHEQLSDVLFLTMNSTENSVSKIGRDHLILFLLMICLSVLFLIYAPRWSLNSIKKLNAMGRRIKDGKFSDMEIIGNDEIANTANIIKSAMIIKENLDDKKSAKIFEIRNVLRAVISKVAEPIIILGSNNKINFANNAAAKMFSSASYKIEGKIINDIISSQQFFAILKKAWLGDNNNKDQQVDLELLKPSVVKNVKVKLSSIHNRDGNISRIVVVFY